MNLFISHFLLLPFNSFGEFDALVLDVERPVVVLDVVAPLLEPLRLQLLAESLLHQSRRGITASVVAQLLKFNAWIFTAI